MRLEPSRYDAHESQELLCSSIKAKHQLQRAPRAYCRRSKSRELMAGDTAAEKERLLSAQA